MGYQWKSSLVLAQRQEKQKIFEDTEEVFKWFLRIEEWSNLQHRLPGFRLIRIALCSKTAPYQCAGLHPHYRDKLKQRSEHFHGVFYYATKCSTEHILSPEECTVPSSWDPSPWPLASNMPDVVVGVGLKASSLPGYLLFEICSYGIG